MKADRLYAAAKGYELPDHLKEKAADSLAREVAAFGVRGEVLQEQIRPCWAPAGGKGPSVLVAVTLNRNGSVARAVVNNRGKAGDSAYRTLADRAQGAILRCGPYRLPGKAYALWRELEVEFFAP